MEEVIRPRSEKLDWVSWTARCDCVTCLCGPWTLSSVALATVTYSRHKNGTHMVNNGAAEIQPSDRWHVCLYTSISFKRAQCVLMFSLESKVRNFLQLPLFRDVYKYEHTAGVFFVTTGPRSSLRDRKLWFTRIVANGSGNTYYFITRFWKKILYFCVLHWFWC
jgi:hypothetical protein